MNKQVLRILETSTPNYFGGLLGLIDGGYFSVGRTRQRKSKIRMYRPASTKHCWKIRTR